MKIVMKKGIPKQDGLYLVSDEKQLDGFEIMEIMTDPEYEDDRWIMDHPNCRCSVSVEEYKNYYFYGPLDIVTTNFAKVS